MNVEHDLDKSFLAHDLIQNQPCVENALDLFDDQEQEVLWFEIETKIIRPAVQKRLDAPKETLSSYQTLFLNASLHDDAKAQYELGMGYKKKNEHGSARHWLRIPQEFADRFAI